MIKTIRSSAMKHTIGFILTLAIFSNSALAKGFIKHLPENNSSPVATIDQVNWIAGHWKGKAFGGVTEEIWSPAQGGSMMATFRLIVDNQVKFYEIEIIRQINSSLVLELKHFSNELKGWEEKNEVVSFPLVEIMDKAVYFDGMTFLNISEKEMHIYVDIEDNGKHSEVLFIYKKGN
jgi:hypothetical protein